MLIGVVAAGAVSALAALWVYGKFEEPVRGRVVPGFLRGFSLFLILAGWFLPPLPFGGMRSGAVHGVLIERSLSMPLAASAGGPSRAAAASAVLDTLSYDMLVGFGDTARVENDPVESAPADGHSLLIPALEAARAAGADSVTLLTDGEIEDRAEAFEAARRLGLAVNEVRVADSAARLAISRVEAPSAAEAGDSIRLVVEVVALGSSAAPDSVTLRVGSSDGTSTIVGFRSPDSGRIMRVPAMVLAPPADGGSSTWQPFDVQLSPEADAIGMPVRHRVWIEVVPTAAGALIVSVDPDWEPHFLLPVLNRSVAGGARAWLRLGSDTWVRSGTDRIVRSDDARVRRDASVARLLVVQGSPSSLPPWLTALLERHPRVLFLARGQGSVPGTGVRIGPPQAGEWFAGGAPPPSPIAGFLQATDYPALPPASRLYGISGFDWAPLEMRRNRAGQPLPPVGTQRLGSRRRAVVGAEGLWRWASRSGPARQAYRSVYAGLAAWLLEAPDGQPVLLEEARISEGESVRWRIAEGVTDLTLTLRASTGAVFWADTLPQPDSLISGPATPSGSVSYEARGTVSGELFRSTGPLEVEGAERELAAAAVGPLLSASAASAGSAAADRAIWPFVLAALLLCTEWFWRRRIGLR
jgi:hypothetical protein